MATQSWRIPQFSLFIYQIILFWIFTLNTPEATKDSGVVHLPLVTPDSEPHQLNSEEISINITADCESLRIGQYYCADPKIDPETQQAAGCAEGPNGEYVVEVPCFPVNGIACNGKIHNGETEGFKRKIPCKWTNGKKFSVALLLSVFLGWLGIDRFYLGYPALGLLKFCTFGFMFIWHLVDMLLIAIQVIKPADGSEYVVDYYGAGLSRISSDNYTYIKPPDYR